MAHNPQNDSVRRPRSNSDNFIITDEDLANIPNIPNGTATIGRNTRMRTAAKPSRPLFSSSSSLRLRVDPAVAPSTPTTIRPRGVTSDVSTSASTSSLPAASGAKPATVKTGFFGSWFETTEEKRRIAAEKNEKEYNEYMQQAHSTNMSDLENLNFVYHPGFDLANRPIVVIVSSFIPARTMDLHRLLLYFMKTLDPIVSRDYVLVYVHGTVTNDNIPPFTWLRKCYGIFNRKYKKNLKALYVIQPTYWLKGLAKLFRPFISEKFWSKLKYIEDPSELYQWMSVQQVKIPTHVLVPVVPKSVPGAKQYCKFFGSPLDQVIKLPCNGSLPIPLLVDRAIDFITKHCLETEGLFRLSGSIGRIEEIKISYDKGDPIRFNPDEEPHVVAGILKLYLRELPDPLMCYDLYPFWVKALESPKNIPKTIQQLKIVISSLPHTNALIFRSLLALLVKVVARQHINKMSAPNIAICWAPNLLKSRDQRPEDALIEATTVNTVFTFILDHHSQLFDECDDFAILSPRINSTTSTITTTTTTTTTPMIANTSTAVTLTTTVFMTSTQLTTNSNTYPTHTIGNSTTVGNSTTIGNSTTVGNSTTIGNSTIGTSATARTTNSTVTNPSLIGRKLPQPPTHPLDVPSEPQ